MTNEDRECIPECAWRVLAGETNYAKAAEAAGVQGDAKQFVQRFRSVIHGRASILRGILFRMPWANAPKADLDEFERMPADVQGGVVKLSDAIGADIERAAQHVADGVPLDEGVQMLMHHVGVERNLHVIRRRIEFWADYRRFGNRPRQTPKLPAEWIGFRLPHAELPLTKEEWTARVSDLRIADWPLRQQVLAVLTAIEMAYPLATMVPDANLDELFDAIQSIRDWVDFGKRLTPSRVTARTRLHDPVIEALWRGVRDACSLVTSATRQDPLETLHNFLIDVHSLSQIGKYQLNTQVASLCFIKRIRQRLAMADATTSRLESQTGASVREHLKIAEPCSKTWEKLTPVDGADGHLRFCSDCTKHVYNPEAMSDAQLDALITATEGKFCAMLFLRRDGHMKTENCPALTYLAVVGRVTPRPQEERVY